MAVHDLEGSGRSALTVKTLDSLELQLFDPDRHRLFLIDNGSTDPVTIDTIEYWEAWDHVTVIRNPTNLGTAAAINLAWKHRKPGEHCIKIDNDVLIHCDNWVEQMEEAIARDPTIGQCGLKRKDCWEHPEHPDENYRSELYLLPHKPGERWIIGEQSKHIIGTCVMHSSALLNKVGYLYQPGLYGFDDVLMSLRSRLAGFKNVFLPHIEIDHIDPGGTEYTGWKDRAARDKFPEAIQVGEEYSKGQRSIYYNPFNGEPLKIYKDGKELSYDTPTGV